jgi:peptidoglycan/xylan/chitin deacetylase (PgdA/CDA1 family)
MRAWTLGALGLVGAAAAWSAPAPACFSPRLARALGIRLRLDAPTGVALTFDDGPHASGTPTVLDELARAGVTATFFLVGEQVERTPSLAAEIAAAGHDVGVHGYRHRLHLRRGPNELAYDLDRAVAAVSEASGTEPACYRPPYGVFSLASLDLVRRRGLEPVLWSRWGRDWEAAATPAAVARRVTADLGGGDVVLLHDADHYSASGSWRRTAGALAAIVESVRSRGDPFVALSQST